MQYRVVHTRKIRHTCSKDPTLSIIRHATFVADVFTIGNRDTLRLRRMTARCNKKALHVQGFLYALSRLYMLMAFRCVSVHANILHLACEVETSCNISFGLVTIILQRAGIGKCHGITIIEAAGKYDWFACNNTVR